MTSRARYTILALGCLAFLIGAPIIVLYVRGIVFDASSGEFINTGIMAVRSEPKNAHILIDGELKLEKEGDIKFLKPREYSLTLTSDGYFDWTKRLSIKANEVTWAQGASDKIHLLYRDLLPETLTGGVSDFELRGDTIVASAGSSVVTSQMNDTENSYSVQLPHPASALIPSPGKNRFLLSSATSAGVSVYDADSRSITDITALVAPGATLAFSPAGNLYALEDGKLSRLDDLGKKTPLKEDVAAFAFQGNNLYLVRRTASTTSLTVSDASRLEEQTILSPLPDFSEVAMVVNSQKEIFIVADRKLFKVNSSLEELAFGVTGWAFDPFDDTLMVMHSGEINFYNNFDKRLELVTRSGIPIAHPLLVPDVHYLFFAQDGKLQAVEMDPRGQQNQYTLYRSGDIRKIAISPDHRSLFLLDGDKLVKLRIR